MSELLTPQDVAKLMKVSPGWVRDHATRCEPRIPVIRIGGRRAVMRFRPEDVQAFILRHLSTQGKAV